MKVTEATKDDVRLLAQLINMINAGQFGPISGADVCAAADSIRWLQTLCLKTSESFSVRQPKK